MCSHYEAPSRAQLVKAFGVEPFEQGELNLRPKYFGPFVRRPEQEKSQDDPTPALEVLSGSFGLIPSWCKTPEFAKKISANTYNSRSETSATKPSFRNAWKRAQHCIIPAVAIYEPDWRTGVFVPTRIARTDGEPLGIAGLREWWKNPEGEIVHSYSMLTINADDHTFMRDYHKPDDEKRMVVILPAGLYND
jgi:putative SOS response-associated peptidase YedK